MTDARLYGSAIKDEVRATRILRGKKGPTLMKRGCVAAQSPGASDNTPARQLHPECDWTFSNGFPGLGERPSPRANQLGGLTQRALYQVIAAGNTAKEYLRLASKLVDGEHCHCLFGSPRYTPAENIHYGTVEDHRSHFWGSPAMLPGVRTIAQGTGAVKGMAPQVAYESCAHYILPAGRSKRLAGHRAPDRA